VVKFTSSCVAVILMLSARAISQDLKDSGADFIDILTHGFDQLMGGGDSVGNTDKFDAWLKSDQVRIHGFDQPVVLSLC
jgi:hypothetical protein